VLHKIKLSIELRYLSCSRVVALEAKNEKSKISEREARRGWDLKKV
jgi:hypothetical protein